MPTGDILAKLPPFQGEEVILVEDQDVDDIVRAVLSRHAKFAGHYDLIAGEFLGGDEYDISKRLFDYVKRSIPYEVEAKEKQTVRSPAAILVMSDYWGVGGDCKHYASFIGGVWDAIGRLTGDPIAWTYRFAGGYDILEPINPNDFGHVFVVVNPGAGDDEIWIDPVLDAFNTRHPWPWNQKDKRPKNSMALVQVSGLPKSITSNVITRRMPANSANGGARCIGDASATTTALDEVEPGLGSAINQAISTLPTGDVQDFLKGLLSNPQQALTQLLKGRTYTSGDYQLGEYYMRNILGMSNVQRWEQVPDTYVPQAWAFFTTAMGVRVRTSSDMDALCGYANTRQARASNYLTRNPTETPDISVAAAQRAAYLLGEPGYDGLFSIYKNRDTKWPMSVFNAQPFIYPIPGVLQNGPLFTGVHPVTGESCVNGYPTSYTGPRYISQTSQTLQSAATLPAGATVPVTTLPGSTTPAGTTVKTSLLDIAGANPLTTVLLVGTGVWALSQGGLKPKRRSVHGPGKSKVIWYIGGGAVLLYFLLKKKTDSTTTLTPAGASQIPASQSPGAAVTPISIQPPTTGPAVTIVPVPPPPVYNIPAPTTGPSIVLNSTYDTPEQTPTLNQTDYAFPAGGGGGGAGDGGTVLQDQYTIDNYAY